MSLFGLFMTVLGIGSVTKDSISDSISGCKAKQEALRKGHQTYLKGTKTIHTKTGEQVYREYDIETGHEILRSTKTGKFVADTTQEMFDRKEYLSKRTANDDCIFYQAYGTSGVGNVWKSTKFPGYWERIENICGRECGREILFRRGDLKNNSYTVGGRSYNGVGCDYNASLYFPDGSLATPEERCKRGNERRKKYAIENNMPFYDIYTINTDRNGIDYVCEPRKIGKNYFISYKKTDDDESIYRFEKICIYGCYIKQKLITTKFNQKRYVDDPEATKYGMDGSVFTLTDN